MMFSKSALGIAALSHACGIAFAAPTSDLMITGYIEGSSFNKFLKISALASLPSGLGDYQVEVYFNGGTTPGATIALDNGGASLEPCDSWIIGDDGESLEPFEADQEVSNSLWNGDDAIVLRRISDNAVMDSFGQQGVDPGSFWSGNGVTTQNESLCRKATVMSGDTVIDDAFDPSLEWNTFPENTFFSEMNDACKCFGSSDPTPTDPPAPTASPSASPTTPPRDVFIHEIQGSSFTSPLEGERVRVEAIVIGDFQNGDADEEKNLGGFWIQEEDDDADDDEATSEGCFVLDDSSVDVSLGDRVVVTGIVKENFGNTAIEAESIEVISSGVKLPSYADVMLPMNLEAVEGMLVEFDQELIITEQFNLDRFSEVRLYAGDDRPYQFTQQNSPSVADFQAYIDELESLTITYEDGRTGSTNDVDYFDGFSPYSTATAPRMGDVIKKLKGVMDYSFGEYRVRSIIDESVRIRNRNKRPKNPPRVGNGLRIASFNVLNYFITFGSRGAEDQEEFDRQQTKLVTALAQLDADILGLVELENNFPAVLIDLVNALNARVGPNVYDYVDPGRNMVDASDAISVGFIYKPSAYSVIGSPAILDDTVAATLGFSGGIFDGVSTNRASLAVTFKSVVGEQCITISNNHFKSKGPSGASGDNADQGDGQGAWNARRTLGAQAVVEWLKTSPTGAYCDREMIMGDLNAYAMEDPIRALLEAGYSNVEDEDDYSFVFDGQIGTLDYILVNEELLDDVKKARVWHINEDEADALDYQIRFGRPATYFDGSVPFRSSDHSPVMVGLMREKKPKKNRCVNEPRMLMLRH